MHRGVIAAILAGTAFCAWTQEESSGPANYLVEAEIYRVSAEVLAGSPWQTSKKGMRVLGLIPHDNSEDNRPFLRLGDLSLYRNGGMILHRTSDHRRPLVTPLARPRIILQPDVLSEVSLQENRTIEYFERVDDAHPELFAHRVGSWTHGIGLKLRISPAGGDHVRVWFRPHASLVMGREPIDGVGLDVGKPIVSDNVNDAQEIWTSVIVHFGDRLVLSHPLPEDDHLLVLLRVQPHPLPPGQDTRKASGVQYETHMHVFDVSAKQSKRLLKSLELDDAITPVAGTAQFVSGVKPSKNGPASSELDAVAAWLAERADDHLIAPKTLLGPFEVTSPLGVTTDSPDAAPRAPRPNEALYGALLKGLFDPHLFQEPDKVAVIAFLREVPPAIPDGTWAYDINGDGVDEVIPSYRRDMKQWRGSVAGFRLTPAEQPDVVNLEFGYAAQEDMGKWTKTASDKSGDASVEQCRFGFDIPVEIGRWVGFTDEMSASRRRILVLVQVDTGRVSRVTNSPVAESTPSNVEDPAG